MADLVESQGQTHQRIQDDTDRDYILAPDQAKDYGIIDEVIVQKAQVPSTPVPCDRLHNG